MLICCILSRLSSKRKKGYLYASTLLAKQTIDHFKVYTHNPLVFVIREFKQKLETLVLHLCCIAVEWPTGIISKRHLRFFLESSINKCHSSWLYSSTHISRRRPPNCSLASKEETDFLLLCERMLFWCFF